MLQDTLSDRVETRFGFREFTARGKSFYLNGEEIVLKTTYNEAFYPHSLAYPRDLELLRKEFKLIKEGNINMIRPWRKPQPPCRPRSSGLRRSAVGLPDGAGVPRCRFAVVDRDT